MNNVGTENLFQQVVSMLLNHFDLEQQASGMNENDVLDLFAVYNDQLIRLLYELKNAEAAYSYVKTDRELRHKVPDIWQLQCERSATSLSECMAKLQLIGNFMNLKFPQVHK
jgi:hypothetical protein